MKKIIPKDILLMFLLTIISIVCIVTIPLNKYPSNILSYILLGLFLSGYVLTAIIYPLNKSFRIYKRIFLSIILSLLLTIIVGLLVRYSILIISISKIFLIIGIITIILIVIALYRTYKVNNKLIDKYPKQNSKIRFSDNINRDPNASQHINTNIENENNLKIYLTRPYPITDLYLMIFLTLISLVVFFVPLTKYLGNLIYPLKILFTLLIFELSGYAFITALMPTSKFSKFQNILLSIGLGTVLLIGSYYLIKFNPLNELNTIFMNILIIFIGLMCIITCLRRIRIPKIGKKEFKSNKTVNKTKKTSLMENEMSKTDNKEFKEQQRINHKIDQSNENDKILLNKLEPQKNSNKRFFSLDLLLIFLTTLVCIILVLTPQLNLTLIKTILGILLILFLPGYSLVAALYPKKDDLDGIERLSLSFGFPIIGLAMGIGLNQITPIAIGLTSILLILSVFTIILVIIAYGRRKRVPKDEKFYVKISSPRMENPKTEKITQKKENNKCIKAETSEKMSKPKFFSLDLLLIFLTTLLAIIFIMVPKLNETFARTIFGLFLILFIPGYSLITALFPKKSDLDGIERTALSFGLSIAVTPLLGLVLNYTPWGIKLTPILISLSAFAMIMLLIAYFRRKRVHEEDKFYVNFSGFFKSIKNMFKGESKSSKILSLILILSIIIAISTTAYIIVNPKQGETFTEFYLLGPGGIASDYPTNLTVGQNASVIIGIVNHESKTVNYHLIVSSDGTIMSEQDINIPKGNKIEIPYNFTVSSTGNKKIEFLLYKLPDNTNIYRSLHIFVNIM
jgi:uncharacterized membrane protein